MIPTIDLSTNAEESISMTTTPNRFSFSDFQKWSSTAEF
jgi:hypothetical protein